MNQMNELNREELLRAFKSTPPAFEAGIDRTLRRLTSEKEEPIVRKKLAFAPALVLALVLLASVALAATLYPKTIERIRSFYGEEHASQIEQYGEIAELGETFTLGEVKYTITDAVWSSGVLYGTIVMEPVDGADILLIAEDMEVDGPVGYNPGYGETAPEGTKSFAETARETNAKIVLAKCVPEGIVVGGEAKSDTVGYSDMVTLENTVLSTFEVYGAQKDDSYVLRLYTSNWEITPEGEWLREEPNDTWKRESWDVTVTPAANETNAEAEGPVNEAQTADGFAVILPENYAQPSVYALSARNFMDDVDPAWFNASGEVANEESRSYRVTFADGAELSFAPEAIFYAGHDGVTMFKGYDGTSWEVPQDDLAGKLYDMEFDVYFEELYDGRAPEAAREEIPAMTLADAKATLDALLAKLGIENVELVWSYGMDLAHINSLNDERNAKIAENDGMGSTPAFDLSAVTEEDGGWALQGAARVGGLQADRAMLDVSAFVDRHGVSHLSLRQNYILGEVTATPEELLSAEQALTKAIDAAGKSWIPEMAEQLPEAMSAELVYAPQTAKGLSLVPAWRISALDSQKDYVFTVDISAVDGALLDAPWM